MILSTSLGSLRAEGCHPIPAARIERRQYANRLRLDILVPP